MSHYLKRISRAIQKPKFWLNPWVVVLISAILCGTSMIQQRWQTIDDVAFGLATWALPTRETNKNLLLLELDPNWNRFQTLLAIQALVKAGPAQLSLIFPLDVATSTQGLRALRDARKALPKSANLSESLLKKAESQIAVDDGFLQLIKKHEQVRLGYDVSIKMGGTNELNLDLVEDWHLLRGAFPQNDKDKKLIPRFFKNLLFPGSVTIQQLSLPLGTLAEASQNLSPTPGVAWNAKNPHSVPLVYRLGDALLPHLALLMATEYQHLAFGNLQIKKGQGLELSKQWIATDAFGQVMVRPNFQQTGIQSAPLTHILSGELTAKNIRQKLVIVGYMNPNSTSAAQATASLLAGIIQDDLISKPYWLYSTELFLLFVLLGFAAYFTDKIFTVKGASYFVTCVFAMGLFSVAALFAWRQWLLPTHLLVSVSIVFPLLWIQLSLSKKIQQLQTNANLAWRSLADILVVQGHLDQAYEALKHAGNDDDTQKALYQLGGQFEQKRLYSEAVKTYQQIQHSETGFKDVDERLSRLSSATGTGTLILGPDDSQILNSQIIKNPVIGRFQIEKELGRGAMAVVYKGLDSKIQRPVAIKTLSLANEFDSNELREVRRRFFREAEAAGRLRHPNIVTIYDVGEENGLAYIAMDFLDGSDLSKHSEKTTLLPWPRILEIGAMVADGLDYAQRQKVVHRDIKPSNIVLDHRSGEVTITDFGVASILDASKTRTGTILGSPAYMSPEQIAGKRVDGRSDLFSLGVTLYQLLTGHLPFQGDSLANIMYKITEGKHKGIRSLRAELPLCASKIINKAMQKNPTERYQKGRDMAEELRKCAHRSTRQKITKENSPLT